jgi:hypothetical protein
MNPSSSSSDNAFFNTEAQDAQNEKAAEVRRLRRLIKDIAELAQHASLTGALQGGASTAARRYNRVVARLEEIGVASPGMFDPLPENTSFDEIGVEATLLAGYLKDDEGPARAGGGNGPASINIIGGTLGDLEGLEELKSLGRMIRENLPDWMRGRAAGGGEGQPGPGAPGGSPPPGSFGARPTPDPAPEPMPDLAR